MSSACFKEAFGPSVLPLLSAAGFSHLEVFPMDHPELTQPGAMARLGRAARDAGLVTWSLHAPFGLTVNLAASEEPARRGATAAVAAALEQAEALGAALVVIHAGYQEQGQEREAALVRTVCSLNELWKRASQRGLKLAIEYLPPKPEDLGNTARELLWMADLIDGEIGFCADVNHINLSEDLPQALRQLGGRVWTTHLSDNDGEREGHWLPGEGVIDWAGLLGTLDEMGYAGPLLLESGNFASLDLADSVAQLARAAQTLVAR